MSAALVILGAGLAGLSAAYQAQKRRIPYLLFEKEARPGGLVRSERGEVALNAEVKPDVDLIEEAEAVKA